MQQRLGFPHGRAGRAARGQQTLLQQHGQIPRLSLGRMNKEGENKNNGEEKKNDFLVCLQNRCCMMYPVGYSSLGLPYMADLPQEKAGAFDEENMRVKKSVGC